MKKHWLLSSILLLTGVALSSLLWSQSFSNDNGNAVHSIGRANALPLQPIGGKQPPFDANDEPPQEKADDLSIKDIANICNPAEPAQTAVAPLPKKTDEGYVINFNNVSITEFIRFLSRISGKNFVFDENDLQFKVTIVSEGMTTQQDVMAALLQVLQIHGLSLLEQGNNLLLYKNANITKFSTLITTAENGHSPVITRVFRLNYLSPDKVRNIVQPLLSGQAIIEVSSETHHLIISDITATIEKVAELLKVLDQPNNVVQIASYQATHHDPHVLIELANKILAPIAASEGTSLTLVPQMETDTIFIISTPDLNERTLSTLSLLDIASTRPSSAAIALAEKLKQQPEFFVYKLQYYKGDKIETSLRKLGASLVSSGLQSPELISAINSMQWMPSNNSLVFTGSKETIDQLKELIKNIDVAPRQVYIEMLVVQTSLANSLTFNVEWGIQPTKNNNGSLTNLAGGFFQVPGATSNSTSGSSTTSSIPDFSPNFTVPSTLSTGQPQIPLNPGFNLGVIGNILRHNGNIYGSLGALLNALQTESYTQIIMNPRLVTTDTSTASVFVGQNTPFTTSTTQIAGAASSTGFTVDYRDVGVYLEITPILGTGDTITLDIHQEINNVSSSSSVTTSSSSNSAGSSFPIPTTNRTVTTTRVHIPNEYFLVISGMIKDERVRTKNQFPCLGGLPLIGGAFSSAGNLHSKNNIIIFIHPRIIDTPDDIGELTDEEGETFYQKSHAADMDPMYGKK